MDMEKDLMYLVNHENNDFSKEKDKAYLFYAFGNNATGNQFIDYDIAQNIEIGSFYKYKSNATYYVMSKQYENDGKIILLCKEISTK